MLKIITSIVLAGLLSFLSLKKVRSILFDPTGKPIRGWTAKKNITIAILGPAYIISMLYAIFATFFLFHYWAIS